MKCKKLCKISHLFMIAISLVLVISAVIPVNTSGDPNEDDGYTVRDPIRIDGNDNFAAQAAAEGWPGDGSEGDPYVIEGYEIDAEGYGCGIYVGNTTKHFVIRGCYIYNASKEGVHANLQKYYRNSGINLYSTRNGRLENNTIRNHQQIGISLWRSDENHIEGNKIFNDRMVYKTGIRLFDSNHNTIIYNNISKQYIGIALVDCRIGNDIHNNTFTDIHLEDVTEDFSTPDDDSPSIGFLSVAVSVLLVTFIVWKKKGRKW